MIPIFGSCEGQVTITSALLPTWGGDPHSHVTPMSSLVTFDQIPIHVSREGQVTCYLTINSALLSTGVAETQSHVTLMRSHMIVM